LVNATTHPEMPYVKLILLVFQSPFLSLLGAFAVFGLFVGCYHCTLTLFCRLPSLNLEEMGKIGAKVPIPDSNVVPRNVKKYLTKRF